MTRVLAKSVVCTIAFLAVVAYWNSLTSKGQAVKPLESTQIPVWRPTKSIPSANFIGDASCAECHADKASTHKSTPMAQALTTAVESKILKSHPQLTFRHGKFSYRIERSGQAHNYVVTDGVNKISEPLLWSFGHGEAGQTYVFAHKGNLYESRVSFYASEKSLDFTIGAPRSTPATITDAIGQPLSDVAARTCFGCHSTGGVFGSELIFENLVPGVRCEACHGPGEKHVAAMKSGDISNKRIFNPAVLNGDRLSQEFCGACHRSVTDVLASPERRGVQSVRFQPYRIFNSKCYSEDRRISCTACHDPHRETERSAAAYDSKCLACHTTTQTQAIQVGAKSMASPHPAATTGCATCHMPKIEVPGAHFKFTDHQIRVVKPGENVPAE